MNIPVAGFMKLVYASSAAPSVSAGNSMKPDDLVQTVKKTLSSVYAQNENVFSVTNQTEIEDNKGDMQVQRDLLSDLKATLQTISVDHSPEFSGMNLDSNSTRDNDHLTNEAVGQ